MKNTRNGANMTTKQEGWMKKDILFQNQIVMFANGKIAIAMTDTMYPDGDELFLIWDPEIKEFVGSQRLCCYNEDLTCNCSIDMIFAKLDNIIEDKNSLNSMEDYEKLEKVGQSKNKAWDVVAQTRYTDMLATMKMLTSDKTIYWLWKRG